MLDTLGFGSIRTIVIQLHFESKERIELGLEANQRTINWLGLLAPKWLLLMTFSVACAALMSFWHYVEIQQEYRVMLRVAITGDGHPVRPLSELVVWLNGHALEQNDLSIKWRPFIASLRYEGTDKRLAVILAEVTAPSQSNNTQVARETIPAQVLQQLRQAESELAIGDGQVASNSEILWVKSGKDEIYLFWLVSLGVFAAVLLVVNFYALVSHRGQSRVGSARGRP